jgi:hypothetical protein
VKRLYSIPHKLITLLVAGAAVSAVIMMVCLNLLRPSEPVIYLVTIIPLVLPMGCIFFWQRRENQKPQTSPGIMAFWRGITSYFLAFNIASFGWKKVFGLQFRPVPLSIADMPMSEQPPDWLMWHFFGYSHTFGMLVAGAQIIGAFLLLSRKTRLLGVMVLLPVMVNILCINFFYQLGLGPLYQSMVLTAGLLYLLLSQYTRLVEVFFRTKEALPSVPLIGGMKWKNSLQLLVMVLAFAYIYVFYLRSKGYSESELHGVYNVKTLLVNQTPVALASTSQDSVLNRVYFDDGNVCIFQYNHHLRRLFGRYEYDAARHTLKSIFDLKSMGAGQYMPRGKADTLQATLTLNNHDFNVTIAGVMGKDSLHLVLQKVR